MPLPKSREEAKRETELAMVESQCKAISNQLENEKHRIYQEIKSYPRPIPACDAQFNHLLELRDSISRELDRLLEARKESLRSGTPGKLLDEFILASSNLGEEWKEQVGKGAHSESGEG